jgi:hypothetical protein
MRRCGKLDRRTVENSRCVKRTAIEWNFVQAGGPFREYASLHEEKVVTARRDMKDVRYGSTGAATPADHDHKANFRVLADIASVLKGIDAARQIRVRAIRGPGIVCQCGNLFGPADLLPVSMAIAFGVAIWTILRRMSR